MDGAEVLLAGLAVVAGAVASVAGFGIGSLLTPALGLIVGTKVAVAIVAVPHVAATAIRLWWLRDHIDVAVLRSFGIASAAGGLLGAVVHAVFSSPLLSMLLGTLLVLSGMLELTGIGRRIALSATAATLAGFASGAFGGLVGNQGGIRSAALLRYDLSPQALVATATASAILVDAVRLPAYLLTSGDGMLEHLPTIALLTVGAVIGTFVGAAALGRLPEASFRRLLAITLIALGVALIAGVGG